jgi:hypothetical protein
MHPAQPNQDYLSPKFYYLREDTLHIVANDLPSGVHAALSYFKVLCLFSGQVCHAKSPKITLDL